MKFLNTDFEMEDLHIKQDLATGMIAIIAIHNLNNGPALGGCRFVSYPSVDAAILDAMKLARAMTYKSAMAGLPLGGGKAVIISHPGITDRKKLLEVYGDFVNSLNGKYITASDSGTNEDDMKIVATRTRFVTSINKRSDLTDDTAAMTAAGMMRAIEAAVYYRFNKNDLQDIHVAIQGVGSVGNRLAKLLLEKGARLTITDKNKNALEACARELSATVVEPEKILEVPCDILSPCALGGVIHEGVIDNVKAAIICGAANNQLQSIQDGETLRTKNILYVPDYVANAGGVICAAAQAGVITKEDSYQKVSDIYQSVLEVLNTSNELALSTDIVANKIAEERFA